MRTVLTVLVVMICSNAWIGSFRWPDYRPFAVYAGLWVAVAIFALAGRLMDCPWRTIGFAIAVSVIGFFINAYYLGQIAASC